MTRDMSRGNIQVHTQQNIKCDIITYGVVASFMEWSPHLWSVAQQNIKCDAPPEADVLLQHVLILPKISG